MYRHRRRQSGRNGHRYHLSRHTTDIDNSVLSVTVRHPYERVDENRVFSYSWPGANVILSSKIHSTRSTVLPISKSTKFDMYILFN